MNIVKNIYEKSKKVESILDSATFKFVFTVILAFGLFFNVMNVFATESIYPNYVGIKAAPNLASEVNSDEDNNLSYKMTSFATSLYNVWVIAAPSYTPGGKAIQESNEVPADMKSGLMGISDQAVLFAYESYPAVDVESHLAEEWVPGYEGGVSSVYAADQPTGYQELMSSGAQVLWAKLRNLSYVLFVVIMIVAGFMIMFRNKLGGQTMVTLGNTLPNIVISLVLVTFSFAIAGLIIDLGGAITSIIASIYDGDVNTISTLGNIMKSVLKGTGLLTTAASSGVIGTVFTTVGALGLKGIALGTVGGAIAGGIGIIGLLIGLVVIGIVLFAGVKLLIALYKAYFGLIISVITGPILLTIGALPGQQALIGNWLKSILRNVLTFPMIFAIVNLPGFLASQESVMLRFPSILVYEDPTTYLADGVDVTNGLFMFVLNLFVLFFAAESSKYLEAWFPPNTPKAVAEGLANAKANLAKIPLVGGMFK